jgi:hypothetical protein
MNNIEQRKMRMMPCIGTAVIDIIQGAGKKDREMKYNN